MQHFGQNLFLRYTAIVVTKILLLTNEQPALELAASRAQAQQLWHTDLVALRHVGSSQTRARTCVPCIGRWTVNHCVTRVYPHNETSGVKCRLRLKPLCAYILSDRDVVFMYRCSMKLAWRALPVDSRYLIILQQERIKLI